MNNKNKLFECKTVEDIKEAFLLESSLSRILQHMKEHDSGSITAFRGKYSKADNKKRNKILSARLRRKGYDLTRIDGVYIENFNKPNAQKVKEEVFFVVDSKNKGNLKKDLLELAKDELDPPDDQDSILFIPKGGDGSILVGSSRNPDLDLSLGQEIPFSKRNLGNDGEFFSSISGRPFSFSESIAKPVLFDGGYFSRLSLSTLDNKNWKDL